MTGAEAVRQAAARLAAAGIEGAARDARWLLAHALGLDPAAVAARLGEPLAPEAAAAFEAAVAARAARQPVSQITGRREFWGRTFRVTPDVLDPRPETETLVALALSEPFATVLDLGTGSGCLLVTLLAERPDATGLGTDVSAAALAVARANAAAQGLARRARFVLADWFEGVSGRFDLIVSNPPYIAAAEIAGLAPEVRDWEPHGALTDGGDGLSAYRAIAAGAAQRLGPGGRLIVETGAGQADRVAGIFRQAGLARVAVHPDMDGRPRAVSARAA
ncbi:MAG: peptide chain release factor N(5)-glutamine methyltransferase [Rhodobacteraceae bacterium]|nr:peptide chain release factor N(5)-glutamine methyltransferase [Paracoccaceae bacterium]